MSIVWGLDAQTEMQKRLQDADLGHLSMNLVDPICGKEAWGRYNNRPLTETKIEQIRSNYHSMGALSCQVDKVIYLPLRPTWFEGPTTPVITGKYVHQVPILKLTPDGEEALRAGLIRPLSGNHRREALVRYCADLANALEVLKLERGDLEGAERDAKDVEIKIMSERVKHAPFWTIKVYDIGASFC